MLLDLMLPDGRGIPFLQSLRAQGSVMPVIILTALENRRGVLPELLDQIPESEETGMVTADDADDSRRCHTAIIDRQATAIIPIRKNGRPWTEDCLAARARNETLRATRHYGRAFWKRWTGNHARSRIEANPIMVCKQTIAGQRMRCLKAFGERIAARHPDSQTAEIQTAEIQIRVSLMNRFNALGTAETLRVA